MFRIRLFDRQSWLKMLELSKSCGKWAKPSLNWNQRKNIFDTSNFGCLLFKLNLIWKCCQKITYIKIIPVYFIILIIWVLFNDHSYAFTKREAYKFLKQLCFFLFNVCPTLGRHPFDVVPLIYYFFLHTITIWFFD